MPILSTVALFFAGLGLFFHGLSGLKQSVQGLASRQVRSWLAHWSQSTFLAGFGGFILGGLTQSVTAVAFIVASLAGGGLLTLRRALPVVACANFGTAALVLVASFDVHLAVLLILGLMGVAVAFDLGGPVRSAFAALFFAALLFFGLRQMKDAFGPLIAMPWFGQVASVLQSSLLAAFLGGAVFRLLIQSSPAIAIIAITLGRGGLLSSEQVIAVIFGTGLGVGGAVMLLSSNLRGVPKQIALYQALLSSAACLVVGGLFAVEHFTGWPLLVHQLRRIPGGEPFRLACAFVSMQVVGVGLAAATSRWAASLLERLAPPTAEQDLGRPVYIHQQARRDLVSALTLAEREQERLLARLPLMVDTARAETRATARVSAGEMHAGTLAVAQELQGFLRSLAEQAQDHETSEHLLRLERRQGLITDASETARDFVEAAKNLRGERALPALLDPMLEGLHALTETVIEAVAHPAEADRALLLAMTADRSEMMERLRRGLLTTSPELNHDTKLQLSYLTALFEREVWLLRQLAQTLSSGVG